MTMLDKLVVIEDRTDAQVEQMLVEMLGYPPYDTENLQMAQRTRMIAAYCYSYLKTPQDKRDDWFQRQFSELERMKQKKLFFNNLTPDMEHVLGWLYGANRWVKEESAR